MIKLYFVFLSFLFISCSKFSDSDLELALRSAGKNRSELEFVLNHYSKNVKDSLKLRSARYLISNMTYHFSYELTKPLDSTLRRIEVVMDSLADFPHSVRDSIYREMLARYENLSFKKVDDTKIISSTFLINNIEHSFKVWKEQKWAQHLTFEQFCEFLLPYKIFDGQVLDDWKEYFFKEYNHHLKHLKYTSFASRNSYTACNILNLALKDNLDPHLNSNQRSSIIKMRTLSKITSGPCDSYTYLANAIMRANGIPTGMDFTPQWPFRSLGHSWNVLHSNTHQDIVFEAGGAIVGSPHKVDHIMVKVFRKSYNISRDIERLINKQKMVPSLFSTPYLEDVTNDYMATTDIKTKVKTDDPYVYLSVFDNTNWKILDYAENHNGIAHFKNVGKDAVFLPVKHTQFGAEPVGDPFIHYLNGTVKKISADTTRKQTIKLYRKYPMLEHVYISNLRKLGMKLQGANKNDFSDAVTFHVFNNFENDVYINKEKLAFKHWRSLSAENGHSNVAELFFYSKDDSSKPLRGNIIGTNGSFGNNEKYRKEAAFDGDLLTFYDAADQSGSWVGMSFEKPVAINRVVCVMRGDGNDIEVGNEYELLHWFNGTWVSLGKKVANDIFLEFDNCPKDALFLLHNKTKGNEQRIFTYENEKQVWW